MYDRNVNLSNGRIRVLGNGISGDKVAMLYQGGHLVSFWASNMAASPGEMAIDILLEELVKAQDEGRQVTNLAEPSWAGYFNGEFDFDVEFTVDQIERELKEVEHESRKRLAYDSFFAGDHYNLIPLVKWKRATLARIHASVWGRLKVSAA